MSAIQSLVRKSIQELKPYSSARDEFSGLADIYLDANESPYETNYNRYPDPHQKTLKAAIALEKGIQPNEIFIGNGSDEAIDLLIRAFCEPNQDSILITEPTYGMYSVCANINGVKISKVTLSETFEIQTDVIIKAIDESVKIIFLCSPNNPSGNLLNKEKIRELLSMYNGLVVIDEAYIDFAADPGFIPELKQFPRLAVLQTFSKAWGLAGLRIGMCFSSPEIISVLNKIKYPYNVNTISQQLCLTALQNKNDKELRVREIIKEREMLKEQLEKLPIVQKVYPTDANFLLVIFKNASDIFKSLSSSKIIVRDRSQVVLCDNCLRITVGTPKENYILLNTLKAL